MNELFLRGAALFLSLYATISLGFASFGPTGYDANLWWVDLRLLPRPAAWTLSALFIVALGHRALLPITGVRVFFYRRMALLLLALILLINAAVVVSLPLRPESGVELGQLLPLSALLAVLVLLMTRKPKVYSQAIGRRVRWQRRLGVLTAAGGVAIIAALAQMWTFGETDYRRPADAILVYGCLAYPDGTPSSALADRVNTACELYHQSMAPVVVMSGGPVGESQVHESEVMANYAVSLGVPREDIVLDPDGLDTASTASNLSRVLAHRHPRGPLRVLAVSHDYHLPRVKMMIERQGMAAFTVPCEVRRGLPGKPYFMARETAALWYYWAFKPL